MAIEVARRRFTVAEYHRMGEAGILREGDRVELIDGEVVEMTPIGSRHAACVNRLAQLLIRSLGEHVVVSVQNPALIPPHSEPSPTSCSFDPGPTSTRRLIRSRTMCSW